MGSRVLALAIAIAGCGRLGFDPEPAPDASIDAVAPISIGPFAAPTVIAELNAAGASDDDVSLTDDGLEIVFNTNRDGSQDVWIATRTEIGAPWSAPAPIDAINSVMNESTTAISGDGLTILFASDRVSAGDHDLLISTRPSRTSAFSAPVAADGLNTSSGDFASYISSDRLTAIIHSDRGGDSDLYIATRGSPEAAFDPPIAIDELNTTGVDAMGRLTGGGRVITFDTDVTGNKELFAATREGTSGPFDPPELLVDLNTPDVEEDLWLSGDLCLAVFSRRDATGEQDLFESRCE